MRVEPHPGGQPAEDRAARADLDIVGMRAQAQNRQRLAGPRERQRSHSPATRNGRLVGAASGWTTQGMSPFSTRSSSNLAVAQRVHGAPEALMLEGHELIGVDQPLERLQHQFLARLHIVEDLRAQDEIAAIDPDVGTVGRAKFAHRAVIVHIDEVVGERRPDGEETGDLAAVA